MGTTSDLFTINISSMEIIETPLQDLKVVIPQVFEDQRGYFLETFHSSRYKELLRIDYDFLQDNQSRSSRGVLRGLHFQKKNPQGKLVRATKGSIFDVAVDLRKGSKTFSDWFGIELSEENKKQLWIPPGFAHGFLSLSSEADLQYKCTDYYDASDEACLIWNDSTVQIDWPIKDPILSKKDSEGMPLETFR